MRSLRRATTLFLLSGLAAGSGCTDPDVALEGAPDAGPPVASAHASARSSAMTFADAPENVCHYDPLTNPLCFGPSESGTVPLVPTATNVAESNATLQARIDRVTAYARSLAQVSPTAASGSGTGGALAGCTATSCATGPAGANKVLPAGTPYVDDIDTFAFRAVAKLQAGASLVGSEDEKLLLSPAFRYVSELPTEAAMIGIPGLETIYSSYGWDFRSGPLIRLAATVDGNSSKLSPSAYGKLLTLLTFVGASNDQPDPRDARGVHPLHFQLKIRSPKVKIPQYDIRVHLKFTFVPKVCVPVLGCTPAVEINDTYTVGTVGGQSLAIDSGASAHIYVRNSENHTLMTEVARYLGNQLKYKAILGNNAAVIAALASAGMSTNASDYNNATLVSRGNVTNDDWIVAHLQEYMKSYFYEYNARPYQIYTVQALHLLYDFASNPTVKRAAGNVLDMQSAVAAVNSVKLRMFAPFRRHPGYILSSDINDHGWISSSGHYDTDRLAVLIGNYGALAEGQITGVNTTNDNGGPSPCGWTSTAGCTYDRAAPYQGQTGSSHDASWLGTALSSYRVPEVVKDLALNKGGNPYYQRLRTGNAAANNAGAAASGNAEVYAASASYLISSGGHFDPDNGLAFDNLHATMAVDIGGLRDTLCPSFSYRACIPGYCHTFSVRAGQEYACPIPSTLSFSDDELKSVPVPASLSDASFSSNAWEQTIGLMRSLNKSLEMSGMPVFTTIVPTAGASDDINDQFRFEGNRDYQKRNNSCVAPGFACGLAPRLPLAFGSADLSACGATTSGAWTFYDFTAPACPFKYGFYLAKYEAACDGAACTAASSTNSYGLMEVYDAAAQAAPVSFAAFKSGVVARNPGAFASTGAQTYTTQAGTTVTFVIDTQWGGTSLSCVPYGDTPNCKYTSPPTSQILSIRSAAGAVTTIPASYASWPTASGDAINASNGRWEITSRGDVKASLVLDSSSNVPAVIKPFKGFLKSRTSGRCLDVAGAPGTTNIDPVQLFDCEPGNAKTDQIWELTSAGYLRSVVSGRCLDIAGSSGTATGTVAQLYDCETSLPSTTDQRWQLTPEGFLQNLLSGKCLDIAGAPGTTNGARAQLWTCEVGVANTDQTWNVVP